MQENWEVVFDILQEKLPGKLRQNTIMQRRMELAERQFLPPQPMVPEIANAEYAPARR